MLNNERKEQSIEDLRERYQDLTGKKIATDTKLGEAKERLNKLKNEAQENWDTDDINELKKKLKEMKAENESKRAKYQEDLDKIEQELDAVESGAAETEPEEEEGGEDQDDTDFF